MRKPRDDVEDVDADEATRRGREAHVEEQHGQDGDGAQALDVRPEVLLAAVGPLRHGSGDWAACGMAYGPGPLGAGMGGRPPGGGPAWREGRRVGRRGPGATAGGGWQTEGGLRAPGERRHVVGGRRRGRGRGLRRGCRRRRGSTGGEPRRGPARQRGGRLGMARAQGLGRPVDALLAVDRGMGLAQVLGRPFELRSRLAARSRAGRRSCRLGRPRPRRDRHRRRGGPRSARQERWSGEAQAVPSGAIIGGASGTSIARMHYQRRRR